MKLTSPAFDPERHRRGPIGTLALNGIIVGGLVVLAQSFIEHRGILYGAWYWPALLALLGLAFSGVAAVYRGKRWGVGCVAVALAIWTGGQFALGEVGIFQFLFCVALFAGVLFDAI